MWSRRAVQPADATAARIRITSARSLVEGFANTGSSAAEMSNVAAVLLDTPFIGAAGLRAHQGLRGASTVGHVRHVETVTVDRPMDVLAAVLSHAEPRHLGRGIGGEDLQGAAILALTGECHRLRPIPWRFGRNAAACQ